MARKRRRRGTPSSGTRADQRFKGRGRKPGPKKGSTNKKPGQPGYTGKR